jgi:hypothetical protein
VSRLEFLVKAHIMLDMLTSLLKCNYYTYISQIYLQSKLRIFVVIFISVCLQHVSAPTGHPQVKHTIIYILKVLSIPQHHTYTNE